jgi:hypothetical protein
MLRPAGGADGCRMNAPLIIFPTQPRRHLPETEMEHFARLAQLHELERRERRRDERRARLARLVHRRAA